MTALDPAAMAVDEAPEPQIAVDLLRRGLPAIPVFVAVAALAAGIDGALSAAVGSGLVIANLGLAAASLAWAARIDLGLLMGVALFGYLVRIGLLFLVVFLLQDLAWIHLPSLGLTLVVMHLGLLLWELRFVSATLSHPGLKPTRSHSSATKERHR